MRSFLIIVENKLFYFFSVFLFRFVLDISYVLFLNPVYEYAGFNISIDIFKYIESIIIMFLFVSLTPYELKKPSDYLLLTMLYGFIIPVLSYYALADKPRLYLYEALLCCSLVILFSKGKRFNIPSVKWGIKASVVICIFFAGFTTVWFLYSSGLNHFNLNFNQVYEYRSRVTDASYKGVMAYIIPWTINVIGPALMGYALCYKRYGVAVIMFFLHIAWFGFSTHKSVVFYPFLIITLWFWFQRSRSLAPIIFMAALILTVSLLIYIFFDDVLAGSLFIRRAFFVIAKNTFLYFEFFSLNEKVYWSNSILADFIDYPYHIAPAKLMGYIQGSEEYINNSFVSTAYMHGGIFGILIYSVIVGFILRVVDSFANNYMQVLLVLSAVLVPSRGLILNADLPTAILTHGVGLALILAFLSKYATDKNCLK